MKMADGWLARGPSDFIRKVRRFLGPQGFTVGLRAGGGCYLEQKLILGVDGRKQVRHQHPRWAGYNLTIHKVKLRPHFTQVLYPEERYFAAVNPARKAPLLFRLPSSG